MELKGWKKLKIMSKNLLIVESPNKLEKIQSFLGKDWIVSASVGHIKDLATWGTPLRLGLDLDEMKPKYINIKDKKEVIEEIKELSNKVKNIYLATDPDREGEAISYHIQSIIENDKANIKRITFNEITKESLLNAIKNPKDIDLDLVHSQESRRILDRIIGFRLSYLTNKKISARSAGRVKSAVLKLIIDRENEIRKFVPENWWTIAGEINDKNKLINVSSDKYIEIKYKTEKETKKILKSLTGEFEFVDNKATTKKIKPPLPLEMATYLMGMYNSYGTPNNSATIAIQNLYEKGIITYPRTDSKRISSKSFIESMEKYISSNYGKEYYEGVPAVKMKKGDQDAHEAIRPVDIFNTPSEIKGLKINEKRAYTLIWTTTVKAFMIQSVNKILKSIYKDGENYFSLTDSFILENGFKIVDGLDSINPKDIKYIKDNLKIDLNLIKSIPHQTTPPARYNPSSLIKLMKDVGIGRPSTYSGVTSGLIGFGYLKKEGNSLKPTEIAEEVNNLLQGNFNDIVNEKYTAEMEDSLDDIANGKKNWTKYLKDFWKTFEPRVNEADEKIPKKPPVYTGKNCPECKKGKLIIKRGRYNEFISCDRFPECRHTEPLVPKEKPKDSGEICPECGNKLVVRKSRRTNTKFISCETFPKCSYILPEEKSIDILLKLNEISKEERDKRFERFNKKIK
ncbi:MAG: DNA topoisomerase 1 [Candidatus Tyloplasma litorale]|nr:MAG: DNA topoisomerase 1 [Mycoplasmatales bacterium]